MARNRNSGLIKLVWRIEWLLYVSLEWFLGLFPLKGVFLFGEMVGSIVYRCSPKYRGIVYRNLRIAGAREGLYDPCEREVEEVFRRNGGNMLTTLVAHKVTPEELPKYLEVRGKHLLNGVLETSGAVVMLAHMGNWEVLTKGALQLETGVPMGALYRPLNNPYVNDLVLKRRESAGMTLISARNPAFALMKILKKGGVVSILSDQRLGNRGSFISFFGRATPGTRLTHLLHEKTGCPLLTVQMETLAPAQWRLTFTRHEELTEQEAMDCLARDMQASLADCFWFQDRWQEFPKHDYLEADRRCVSTYFGKKTLIGIVESRAILEAHPEIEEKLADYELLIWDEGASPREAYFAIGSSPEFFKACRVHGLKKATKPVEEAKRYLGIR